MIINSKFHDYYDHCIGYGVDKGIVFNRETSIISQPARCSPGRSASDDAAVDVVTYAKRIYEQIPKLVSDSYSTAMVGFCGKVYLCVMRYMKEGKPVTNREFVNGIGEPECRWFEKEFSDKELTEDITTEHWWLRKSNPKTLGEWFERTEGKRVHENVDLFIKHDLVSYYLDSRRLILNPVLKNLNFQKAVDGVTAFQEIAMHVSGVLGQTSMIAEPVSDVLKAATKGFDNKSFRKGPTKRG